jgi:hypothetical protein
MVKKILIKDKKGWIKILEVFIAIMLISGIMVVLVNQTYKGEGFERSKILDIEEKILRELQLNDSIRNIVLGISEEELPKNNSIGNDFPKIIEKEINKTKPFYLECYFNICEIDSECNLNFKENKGIYADSVGFFANETTYNPRKLKIFCWKK